MPRNSHLRWAVKYSPGTLLARGYNDGKLVAEDKVETAGAPAFIQLTADRVSLNAGDEDVAVINMTVLDAKLRVVPTADNLINLDLTGPGRILGVGNGNPRCLEADTYVADAPARDVAMNEWRMLRVPDTHDRPEIQETFDDSNWEKVNTQAELMAPQRQSGRRLSHQV